MVLNTAEWGLRDYSVKEQIGLEQSWQQYVEKIRAVAGEVWRVLKPHGNFYLILGDTFMQKQKLGIPWRIRFALNADGWLSRSDIVWYKPNSMPSSVKDRLNTTYEMIFQLVKQKKYYFDLDAIRIPHKTQSLARYQKTVNLRADCVREAFKKCRLRKPPPGVSVTGGHAGLRGRAGSRPLIAPNNPWGNRAGGGDNLEKHSQRLERKWSDAKRYNPDRLSVSRDRCRKRGEPEGNPLGKNPGDVVKTQTEVIRQNKREGRLKMSEKGSVPATQDYHYSFDSPYKQGRDEKYPEGPPNRLGHGWGEGYGKHTFLTGNHPLGKNPGDVFRSKTADESFKVRGMRQAPEPNEPNAFHKLGKNPGNVVYDSKYARQNYGQTLQGFIRSQSLAKGQQISRKIARQLFPNNPKKQQEFINYIHDHDGHPLGKNPGDIIREGFHHGSSLSRRAVYYKNRPVESYPLGRNPGDFWSITTRPFPDAHFAVFPETLVEPWIKSSCPQWVCSKCGKPRKRIVKVARPASYDPSCKADYADKVHPDWHNRPVAKIFKDSLGSSRETIGWTDCGCKAGFKPGVVLDPFIGSGTVAVVAKRLGRNFIGIDIKSEYVKMARTRLQRVKV